MRFTNLRNKPRPKNSNIPNRDFELVGVLDSTDRLNGEMLKFTNEFLSADRLVPIAVLGNKRQTELVYDLSNYMCSLKVRTEVATYSFEEVIVTLFELLDTYRKAFVDTNFPATHIYFDYDKVFISKNGTVAFMINPASEIRDNDTFSQMLSKYLHGMRLTEANDSESIRRLIEFLPKNPGDTLKGFIEFVTSMYNKIMKSVENGNVSTDVKDEFVRSFVGVDGEKESSVTQRLVSEVTPNANEKSKEQSQKSLVTESEVVAVKTEDEDYFSGMNFYEDDRTSFESITTFDDDKTEMLVKDSVETERYVLERVDTGQQFNIDMGSSYIIGRSAKKSDIVLDKNSNISGQHCELMLMYNHEVCLKDLGSKNGTFYEGMRLDVGRQTYIAVDEVFKLATEEFKVVKVVN